MAVCSQIFNVVEVVVRAGVRGVREGDTEGGIKLCKLCHTFFMNSYKSKFDQLFKTNLTFYE